MQASQLDRYIVIQQKDGSQNPDGSYANVWATVYSVWANVVESASNEMIRARSLYSELTAIFTIRWRSSTTDEHCGVNSKMRIIHHGQVYEILGVENVGRKQFIRIFTKKYSDQVTAYN